MSRRGKKNAVPPEFEMFIGLVGSVIESWGYKKVHGRVWALLFLSNRSMDASEIASQLKVSVALLSITLQALIEHQVVEMDRLENKGGRKSVRTYRAVNDPFIAILGVLRSREEPVLQTVSEALHALEAAPPSGIDAARLRYVRAFVDVGQSLLKEAQVFAPMLVERSLQSPQPPKR